MLPLTELKLVETMVEPSGRASFGSVVVRKGVGLLKAMAENIEAARRLLRYIFDDAKIVFRSKGNVFILRSW